MGLADRDYARPGPRGGGYGGRGLGGGSGRGWGQMGLLSFNSWLIILNIAVFVGNNFLLANVMLRVSAGEGYYSEVMVAPGVAERVTPEMRRRAVVDRSNAMRDPDQPAMLAYHPIVDPDRAVYDPAGNLMLDRGTGRFSGEIGRERFMYRPVLEGIGHFSTGKAFIDLQLWRFLTFQFLHANLLHLLFNMLGLWFVGGMVEERLGSRRYAAFYLLCGAAGAGFYLLLNLLGYGLGVRLPGVLFSDPYTPLVGASAGVFGILLAAAALYPREIVDVMFVLPMRLRTAVYIFTGLAALNLIRQGANAGGDAAHLGGAIAGAYLIRRPHVLNDVVEFFRFSKRSKGRGGGPRRPAITQVDPPEPEGWFRDDDSAERDAVDRILEKVHSSGLNSLTEQEKEILRRASGRSES